TSRTAAQRNLRTRSLKGPTRAFAERGQRSLRRGPSVCGDFMREVQRLVIVDPCDATREPLRNLLLGIESVWLEAECSRYEFFLDVVHQSNPDVAVVALDADHQKALALIGHLAGEVPDLPILAVSGQGDGQSILQALRSGAREFLTQPVVLEELLVALSRLGQKKSAGAGATANGTTKAGSLV